MAAFSGLKNLVGLLILLIAFASCQAEQAPEPTKTEPPPSITPTDKPSLTPEPSQTLTPFPTPVPQTESSCPLGGWTLYTEKNGLVENWVKSVAVDKTGQVWAGFSQGRVNLLQNGNWITLPHTVGAPFGDVRTLLPLDDGSVLVGTQSGEVGFYSNHTWKSWDIKPGGENTSIYAVEVSPGGVVFAGTWHGLFQLQGDEFTPFTKPLPDNYLFTVKSLLWDSGGRLWVGGKYGIHYFQSGTWRTFTRSGSDYYDVVDIEERYTGELWFGTMDGVYTYSGDIWKRTSPEDLSNDSDPDRARIESLAIGPDGKVWIIVNGNEVQIFEKSSWRSVPLEKIDPESQLNQVDIDPWGAAWFATYEGVLCYNP